jgi:sarcosine oxidase subunit beta
VANDEAHELIGGFSLDRFRNYALTGEKGAASVGH